jgi:hypothetical protein
MSGRDPIETILATEAQEAAAELLQQPDTLPAPKAQPIYGVVIGELVALSQEGRRPLVIYSGQMDTSALPARTVVDLHGKHIGKAITLMFENGDPARPIVMGILREHEGWPLEAPQDQVEVDADGARMIVSAKEQLVLRCGKSSITLTKSGKVLIEGSYLLSKSTGVNRVKGGSVQLN